MPNHQGCCDYSPRNNSFTVTCRSRLLIFMAFISALVLLPSALAVSADGDANKISVSALQDIVVQNSSYQDYRIGRALLSRKAALLTFPGVWDPYSIHSLKVLRNVEARLSEMNIQIIAVTIDSPLKVGDLLEKYEIPFVVVSDPENQVARKLGAIEEIGDTLESQLKGAGVSMQGQQSYLPALKLFLFGQDGILQQHWKPTPEDLLLNQERVLDMAIRLAATTTSD